MEVASQTRRWLHCSWCLPVAHSSGWSYLGCGFGECLAQTGSVEGVYLRLLRNKLLTKDNLVKHDIIFLEHHFCVSGCSQVESTQHLILHCNFFRFLWLQVRSWIGIYSVNPHNIMDDFHRFSHSKWGSCARRNFLQLLWFASVCVLWT